MRASKGETSRAAPPPRSRSSRVARKYTALLPQPVRCTTRTRPRPRTNRSIASHCPGRNAAAGLPVRRRRSPSASARVVITRDYSIGSTGTIAARGRHDGHSTGGCRPLRLLWPDANSDLERQLGQAAGASVAAVAGSAAARRGYAVALHGQAQWNGVAILSRVGLDDIVTGLAGAPGWSRPEARAVSAT